MLLPLCLFQIETHVDGQRVRYFQDDDNVGLQEMVRREKMSSAQDQNALYSRMAGKVRRHFITTLRYRLLQRGKKKEFLSHSAVLNMQVSSQHYICESR